jgi:hypothetical protein
MIPAIPTMYTPTESPPNPVSAKLWIGSHQRLSPPSNILTEE